MCFVLEQLDVLDAAAPVSVQSHVLSGGRTPRNFCVSPSGSALAVVNQDSRSLILFDVEELDGSLVLKQWPGAGATLPALPACVSFVGLTV